MARGCAPRPGRVSPCLALPSAPSPAAARFRQRVRQRHGGRPVVAGSRVGAASSLRSAAGRGARNADRRPRAVRLRDAARRAVRRHRVASTDSARTPTRVDVRDGVSDRRRRSRCACRPSPRRWSCRRRSSTRRCRNRPPGTVAITAQRHRSPAVRHGRRRAAAGARRGRRRQRRARQRHVGVSAGRRIGLHAGARRRRQAQQLRRRVRLRPPHHGRPRVGRGGARPAERRVRRRRHRRRRPGANGHRRPDGGRGRLRSRAGYGTQPVRGRARPGTAGAVRMGRPRRAHRERRVDGQRAGHDDAGVERRLRGHDRSRWQASWQPAAATTLRLDSRFGRNERGNPGPFGSNPIGAFPGIDTVVARPQRPRHGRGVADARVESADGRPRCGVRGCSSTRTSRAPWGDSMSQHAPLVGARAVRSRDRLGRVGLGRRRYRRRTRRKHVHHRRVGRAGAGRRGRSPAYFAEARVRGGSRLAVTGGLRVEHIVRVGAGRRSARLHAHGPRCRPTPSSRRTRVSPRATTCGRSAESGGNWTRLHASAGTGIRAPDAFEIAFTDNPGLKPERSRSVDAGFEQSVFGGRVVLDVHGLHTTRTTT